MNVPKNTSSKTPMIIGIVVCLVILIVSVIFLTSRSGKKQSLESESEPRSEKEKPKLKPKPKKEKKSEPPPLPSKTLPPPPPPPPPKGPKPGTLPRPPMNSKGEKSVNELTDEEYIKYNESWRHKNFGGTYDKNDHPDRFKRKFQKQKIDLLKKKEIFSFLPDHHYSFQFHHRSNNTWKNFKDSPGEVDESHIIKWLDTDYLNKSRGNICPNPSNPRDAKLCYFPYHTLTLKEILDMRNANAKKIQEHAQQKIYDRDLKREQDCYNTRPHIECANGGWKNR